MDMLVPMMYSSGAAGSTSSRRTSPKRACAGSTTAKRLQEAADDLVDYLLFVYEAPIPDKIRGSSGFAETFAALGPSDSKGRSLRQFDLDQRLMRYPCSYMIYSDAFDALPDSAKNLVYRRRWKVFLATTRTSDTRGCPPPTAWPSLTSCGGGRRICQITSISARGAALSQSSPTRFRQRPRGDLDRLRCLLAAGDPRNDTSLP